MAIPQILADHASTLLRAGLTREQAVDAIAELVDDLIDWRDVIPGGIGELAEGMDEHAARLAAGLIVDAIPDPAARAERLRERAAKLRAEAVDHPGRAAGMLRRAARKERRASHLDGGEG